MLYVTKTKHAHLKNNLIHNYKKNYTTFLTKQK